MSKEKTGTATNKCTKCKSSKNLAFRGDRKITEARLKKIIRFWVRLLVRKYLVVTYHHSTTGTDHIEQGSNGV